MSVCNHIKTQVQTVDRVMERFVGVIVILSGCVWPQTIEHWNDQLDRYQRPWRRALPAPRVVWEHQSIAEDGAQRGCAAQLRRDVVARATAGLLPCTSCLAVGQTARPPSSSRREQQQVIRREIRSL
jgi:hypothetical protein